MPRYDVEFELTRYGVVQGIEATSHADAESQVVAMSESLLGLFVNSDSVMAEAYEVEDEED